MRLEVFNITDETTELLAQRQEFLQGAAAELQRRLTELFSAEAECFINMAVRVKSEKSLREKIIRKKLYKRYADGAEIIDHLSDLVGARVECRFIRDEAVLFQMLRRVFCAPLGEYCVQPGFEDIRLLLSAQQPQKQKNGADIYRIDGLFVYQGSPIRFELQIKSLVKVFWAEIEHKIVYKNNSYHMIDDFLVSLMQSINDNLVAIDRQLMLVYEQMNKNDSADEFMRREGAKKILARSINEVFYNKMDVSMGFTINFKQPCEILAEILYDMFVNKSADEQIDTFQMLVVTLGRISNMEFRFDESLVFEREIETPDCFSATLSQALSAMMNEDFEWNLFFRILFIVQPQDNAGDFEHFLHYLRSSLEKGLPQLPETTLETQVWEDFLAEHAQNMIRRGDISCIYPQNLEAAAAQLAKGYEQAMQVITEPAQWEKYKAHYFAQLCS